MVNVLHTVLFTLFAVVVGVPLSYYVRRAEMQGFEIWLQAGMLLAIAVSPAVGLAVALMILLASWVMFPYRPGAVIVIGICLAGMLYATTFFAFTEANFLRIVMLLTVAYNVVSNSTFLILRANWFTIFKFIALSIWVSWLIYSQIGWQIVLWLG